MSLMRYFTVKMDIEGINVNREQHRYLPSDSEQSMDYVIY